MAKQTWISKSLLAVSSLLMLLLLSFLDFHTGELSFSIFYLLPIYLATWRIGRLAGIIFSLCGAAGWLAADLLASPSYTYALTPWWNMTVRLGFFLLTVYLISMLQRNEQRRRSLEELFYHDILNIVGSIRGFAELLKAYPDANREEIYSLLQAAAEQSIEEIETQRDLTALEYNELTAHADPLNSLELIRQAVAVYTHHPRAKERRMVIAEGAESIDFTSDRALILRILGNLLKNALEAASPGETVTLGAHSVDGGVEFRVHNPAVIPAEIKQGIFRRNVSTKGTGRGFGTYSIATLCRFLQGRAQFTSTPEEGTTFRVWLPIKLPPLPEKTEKFRPPENDLQGMVK